jgi:hypothetical protein
VFVGLTVSQVIFLIHEDTLPDVHVTLPQLCHLATTTVKIGSHTQSSRENPIASILHKKQGGKISRQVSETALKCRCYSYLSIYEQINLANACCSSVYHSLYSIICQKIYRQKSCPCAKLIKHYENIWGKRGMAPSFSASTPHLSEWSATCSRHFTHQ